MVNFKPAVEYEKKEKYKEIMVLEGEIARRKLMRIWNKLLKGLHTGALCNLNLVAVDKIYRTL